MLDLAWIFKNTLRGLSHGNKVDGLPRGCNSKSKPTYVKKYFIPDGVCSLSLWKRLCAWLQFDQSVFMRSYLFAADLISWLRFCFSFWIFPDVCIDFRGQTTCQCFQELAHAKARAMPVRSSDRNAFTSFLSCIHTGTITRTHTTASRRRGLPG